MAGLDGTFTTDLSEVTLVALFGMFPDKREKIAAMVQREGVDGVVIFENRDFWSSHLGRRTAMVYGPSCIYKTLEQATNGHLASRRMYPKSYYSTKTRIDALEI